MSSIMFGRGFLFTLPLVLAGVAAVAVAEEEIDYNRQVRPILSDRCFSCHGPDKEHREADLRLDVEEHAKEWAIIAGKPAESVVVERITETDPKLRMPPPRSGKELSAEEIKLLTRWIEQGAKYEPYWAYVPPKSHPTPTVRDGQWPNGWIDRFILARLEQEKLTPSPNADRRTLIRRLSFDLTGLPPTPAEVKSFVADKDPLAYPRLVDRLLASPHFGERMAIYWLDLVRFADTVGYHGDQDHNISPYRDWVIEAFNENLPFDEFTQAQLAGDLLPEPGPGDLIASGYNRLLQTSHEGGVQPKEYLAIYGADRVRNVSLVWMGATVGCAQCHDHKYDPYTAKDFYALQSFFADLDEAQHFRVGSNALPTRRPPEVKLLTGLERERIAILQRRIAALTAEPESADRDQRLKQLRAQLARLEKAARVTMISKATTPRTIRVLPRGDWLDDSGPIVQPAPPEFLTARDEGQELRTRQTRLDLARWLTEAEDGVGGLTARVMANRIWALLLGTGLSRSLDDFGGQGSPPEHPELLDQLALEFQRDWDVKRLVRQIVLSRTYRQSSRADAALLKRDPYNELFARQSRFRLPAEMVRDNALAVSGLLIYEQGGASVKPYQPAGYYRHLNFPTRRYQHHADPRQWRRGVYVHWQRQFLHPMLKALDAPSREECTAERSRSNTPLAALVLLNDPTFVEAARTFAARTLRDGGKSDAERLRSAFVRAISRRPDPFEQKALLELLDSARAEYRDNPEAAAALLKLGLAPAPTDLPAAELAAWTQVTRALLNLNEAVMRN